jgi:dipeptidyl aminopeptidase/acylaminoacyl peptidase
MSTRRWLPALALAALAAVPSAAGDRPWTTDDILALKVVTDPNVSPDGRMVAYVVESLNAEKDAYQTDVWLVGVAGGEPRALASSVANDDTPRWSPDGHYLAFLSERPRPGATGDEAADAKRQLWLIRPDGGEAEPLTAAPGAVSAFEWSADGKTVGFLAREPKSEARRKREKEKDDAWTPSDNYPWNRLWVIDVASRKATQLTRGETHVSALTLSPDGKQVAYAAQPTPLIPDSFRSDLYVVPAAGGEPTKLVAQKRTGARQPPLDRRQGRDARLPARGLGLAARGVDAVAPGRGGRQGRATARARRFARSEAPHRYEPADAGLPVVPEGDRHVEGRSRPGHGGPARLSDGLREGPARAAHAERPRRTRGNALEQLHAGRAPLGLADLRPGRLRGLLPEPARQRGLRRGLPLGERGRLGRQGLRGPDEGRGCARRERDRGPRPPRGERLVVRRLHDLDHLTKTDRFKAAIVGAAVTNLASFTGTTDIPDFSRSYFRKWPWEDATAYVEHSALFRAGKVKTPSLVVHGDKDDRVPISQGYEFYAALRARGVPTDFLVLPRQPHGPREPKLLRTCQEWILRWTEKYTRGR